MSPILAPVNRSRGYFFVYLVIFMIKYIPFYLFMIPHVPVWGGMLAILISVVAILSFTFVSNKDPGYIKSKGKSLFQLYEKYAGDFVCPYCEVKKPHWAKH
jgi:hypothetical protein